MPPLLGPCLPTSSSAILGPAVLVQFLGIFIIILISHWLLTFSILEFQKEGKHYTGTINTAPKYTLPPFVFSFTQDNSDLEGQMSAQGLPPVPAIPQALSPPGQIIRASVHNGQLFSCDKDNKDNKELETHAVQAWPGSERDGAGRVQALLRVGSG